MKELAIDLEPSYFDELRRIPKMALTTCAGKVREMREIDSIKFYRFFVRVNKLCKYRKQRTKKTFRSPWKFQPH